MRCCKWKHDSVFKYSSFPKTHNKFPSHLDISKFYKIIFVEGHLKKFEVFEFLYKFYAKQLEIFLEK